jgi:hypothetical protein
MQATYVYATRLLYPFRIRSHKSGTPSTLTVTRPPLFQRVPPWWARWTVGLLACDIFMTCVHLNISASSYLILREKRLHNRPDVEPLVSPRLRLGKCSSENQRRITIDSGQSYSASQLPTPSPMHGSSWIRCWSRSRTSRCSNPLHSNIYHPSACAE